MIAHCLSFSDEQDNGPTSFEQISQTTQIMGQITGFHVVERGKQSPRIIEKRNPAAA